MPELITDSPEPVLATAPRPAGAAERRVYAVGLILIAVGLAHLVVAVAAPRAWYGPLSWRKPVTFGVSFGLVLISITWVASYLRVRDRVRTALLAIFAIDSVVEVGGITVQAWRHVPSHFNTETPFDTVIAMSLAVGGAVLIAVLGTLASVALRGRVDAAPGMQLAIRAGFALLLVGLAAGVAMIVRGEVLVRTGHRMAAYDSAGFLKWVHGITLHAVLVLPGLAWVLERRTAMPEAQRVRIVRAAAGAYVMTTVIALGISLALVR